MVYKCLKKTGVFKNQTN